MKVVCNSSPLILFSRAGLLDVLKSLFDNLLIPQEVFDEVTRKGKPGEKTIKNTEWIITVKISEEDPVKKTLQKIFYFICRPFGNSSG
jgi:predicted nucleic acid-binding protein